jgi:filamentous hemagglutinin
LKAGDQGFQVTVGGDTTLAGGAITSTQQAVDQGSNAFSTGGVLATADIHNQASYSARSAGVNLGTGFDPNGKLAPGGTSAAIGQASGRANSTTQAAISGIAGNREARFATHCENHCWHLAKRIRDGARKFKRC